MYLFAVELSTVKEDVRNWKECRKHFKFGQLQTITEKLILLEKLVDLILPYQLVHIISKWSEIILPSLKQKRSAPVDECDNIINNRAYYAIHSPSCS